MTTTNRSHTDGLLVVDKPAGWTSHDVVGRCRRIVGQKRIGHAGTLDPGATGVLLVGLGRAARLMRFVGELPKSYTGEIVLGSTTSTLDDEGEVTATFDMAAVGLDDVRSAAAAFVGAIQQIPPMVSAVKVDGRRLHELARAGIEVERKPRPVTIHRISVDAAPDPGVYRLEVECSSGTYVRTLAADIGERLGGGAHLRRLRRTAIGPFTTASAVSVEALEEDWQRHVLPPAAMVTHFETVKSDEETVRAIAHGKPEAHQALDLSGAGPWAVLDPEGRLAAVYELDGDRPRAAVVLAGQ